MAISLEEIRETEKKITSKVKELLRFEDKMKERHASFFVRWSRYFIDRWRVTIILILAIFIAGFMGIKYNQRQDFPSIPANFLIVSASYSGASSVDVEKEVVIPIEQAVEDVENTDNIRSSAADSFGMVQVEMDVFDKETLSKRAGELADEIDKLGLPSDVEVNVSVADASGPTMAVGIVGDNKTTNELLEHAATIKTSLETTSKEIKKIEIWPGDEFKVSIELDSEELYKNQLDYFSIKQAIQSQLATLPGGSVQADDGLEKTITIKAPAQTVEDIENISLGSTKIRDIATVDRGPINTESFTIGGYVDDGTAYSKESVYLVIFKKDMGDSIRISDSIIEEIDDIKKSGKIPSDIDVVTLMDSAPGVSSQIGDLFQNGWMGLLLIMIVLLFFINLRASIVVSLILPLAFLLTLAVLLFLGFTINILTLFGMILALGILVDNAIVVTEGMLYELERGASKRDAALITVRKLAGPITSATATTMVVFIPFAMMGGIMGEFMKYIPYTIIIMMLCSYFLALTITPLFGKWFLKEDSKNKGKSKGIPGWQKVLIIPIIVNWGQHVIDAVARWYKRAMYSSVRSWATKIALVIVTVIFIVVGVFLAGQIGGGEFPNAETAMIVVSYDLPTGMPYEEQKEIFSRVGEQVITVDHFQSYYVGDEGGDYMSFVVLTEPKDRKDNITTFDIEDDLNEKLSVIQRDYNDIELEANMASYGPTSSDYDIILEAKNEDLDVLKTVSEDIEQYVSGTEESDKYLNGYTNNLLDSVLVDFDPAKLEQNGISNYQAAGIISSGFFEEEIGKLTVRKDGVSDDVIISFEEEDKDSISDLKKLRISPTGATLSDVADIQEVEKLQSINRLDRERVVELKIGLKDDEDVAKYQEDLEEFLGLEKDDSDNLVVKDGNTKLEDMGFTNAEEQISFGGAQADMDTDFTRLLMVAVISMIAVYIILVNQFHSYIKPVLIMTTVFMALFGMMYGLTFINFLYQFLDLTSADETLNMITGLGLVALIGIAVNDAIVYIDTFNRLRKEHPDASLSKILSQTGYLRFKPIFSTSITTILGVLPLTIADPFWRGLGMVIMSGLVFSTLGTLFLIPVFYALGASVWNAVILRLVDWLFKTKFRAQYRSKVYGGKDLIA